MLHVLPVIHLPFPPLPPLPLGPPPHPPPDPTVSAPLPFLKHTRCCGPHALATPSCMTLLNLICLNHCAMSGGSGQQIALRLCG